MLGLASLQTAAEIKPPFLRGEAGRVALTVIKQSCKKLAKTLNESQVAAIRVAAASTLTVWQGPPGTGVTSSSASFSKIKYNILLDTLI